MASSNGELAAEIATKGGKTTALAVTHQLKEWKDKNLAVLQKFLGGHQDDAERMYLAFTYSVSRSTDLLACTKESLITALLTCAQLGLYPGPMQEAALLHFYNKKKGAKEAQFVPMYQGLVRMAVQCGGTSVIHPGVVYERDIFDFSEGTDRRLDHRRLLTGDRGERVAAYCTFRLPGADKDDFRLLSAYEIGQIKARSMGAGSGFSPWNSERSLDVDGMWMKSAIKQACKAIPKRGETGYRLSQAIELDNALEAPDLAKTEIVKFDDISVEGGDE